MTQIFLYVHCWCIIKTGRRVVCGYGALADGVAKCFPIHSIAIIVERLTGQRQNSVIAVEKFCILVFPIPGNCQAVICSSSGIVFSHVWAREGWGPCIRRRTASFTALSPSRR